MFQNVSLQYCDTKHPKGSPGCLCSIPPYCYTSSTGFGWLDESDFKYWCLPTKTKKAITPHTAPHSLRPFSTTHPVPPSLREQERHQESSIFYVHWWNERPLDVWTAESLAVFKRRVKSYLFLNYLNCISVTWYLMYSLIEHFHVSLWIRSYAKCCKCYVKVFI